jgi:hypothetical protein
MRKRLSAIGSVAKANAEELGVLVMLALISAGLWPYVGQGALVVPGLVGLWLLLPSRLPFLVRPPGTPDPRRK